MKYTEADVHNAYFAHRTKLIAMTQNCSGANLIQSNYVGDDKAFAEEMERFLSGLKILESASLCIAERGSGDPWLPNGKLYHEFKGVDSPTVLVEWPLDNRMVYVAVALKEGA